MSIEYETLVSRCDAILSLSKALMEAAAIAELLGDHWMELSADAAAIANVARQEVMEIAAREVTE